MFSDEIKRASDEIAREASELTDKLLSALGLNKGDEVSAVINQDMISMVFALHFSSTDDFTQRFGIAGRRDECFSYYLLASNAPDDDPVIAGVKREIVWATVSGMNRDEIIENTINRLNWYFQKGEVSAYGEKAQVLPRITDLATALGAIENTLRTNLKKFTYETLGYIKEGEELIDDEIPEESFQAVTMEEGNPDVYEFMPVDFEENEGIEDAKLDEESASEPAVPTGIPEDAKAWAKNEEPEPNAPFMSREYQEAAMEREMKENTVLGKDGKPLGMRFHMFWVSFGLMLGAMLSGMYCIMSIINIFQIGPLAIVDLIINGGWFVFGIPAIAGMGKFTKKGYKNNMALLVYSMGISVMMIIMYAIMVGSAGITIALMSHGPRFVIYLLIWFYYRKRAKYFKY